VKDIVVSGDKYAGRYRAQVWRGEVSEDTHIGTVVLEDEQEFLQFKNRLGVPTPEQKLKAAEKLYTAYRDSIFRKPDDAPVLINGEAHTVGQAKREGLDKFPWFMLEEEEKEKWVSMVEVVVACLR
jgi:hypothetical protein